MADQPTGGFITQAQTSGGSGGGTSNAPAVNATSDTVSKETVDLINKAIQQYDGFIKAYLKAGYLQEDFSYDTVFGYIKGFMNGEGFTARKITDTPTDALAITNRQFVTLNGATAGRPGSPVTGQFYYNTTTNKPEWYSGSQWRTPSVMLAA